MKYTDDQLQYLANQVQSKVLLISKGFAILAYNHSTDSLQVKYSPIAHLDDNFEVLAKWQTGNNYDSHQIFLKIKRLVNDLNSELTSPFDFCLN